MKIDERSVIVAELGALISSRSELKSLKNRFSGIVRQLDSALALADRRINSLYEKLDEDEAFGRKNPNTTRPAECDPFDRTAEGIKIPRDHKLAVGQSLCDEGLS